MSEEINWNDVTRVRDLRRKAFASFKSFFCSALSDLSCSDPKLSLAKF